MSVLRIPKLLRSPSGPVISSLERISIFNPDEASLSVTTNEWRALDVVPNVSAYAEQVPGATAWALDPDTGILTYRGNRRAVFHFNVSLAVAVDGEAGTKFDADLTVNGEDIGSSNGRSKSQHTQTSTSDDAQVIALAREIEVFRGDTIQTIVRNVTNEDNGIIGPYLLTGIRVS